MSQIVGIVDCGRARWKVRAWSSDGQGLVPEGRFEVEIGTEMSPGVAEDASRKVLAWMRDHHVSDIVVVAAAAVRDNPQLSAVISSSLGSDLRVLDSGEESALFLEAVRDLCHPAKDALAVDIGGGSIQIGFPGSGVTLGSLRLGTHSIESDLRLPLGSSGGSYLSAMSRVTAEVTRLVGNARGSEVIAGSNAFRQLFGGIAAFLTGSESPGLVYGGQISEPVSFADLSDIAVHFQNLPPKEFERFMPALPGFMYGADKALIVLVAVMTAVDARWARGTDVGISDGLALRLIREP